jgi:hypothetical protein
MQNPTVTEKPSAGDVVCWHPTAAVMIAIIIIIMTITITITIRRRRR